MAKYRYWWYDYLKKSVIRNMSGKAEPQTIQEAAVKFAVKKALAVTEQMDRGPERMQLIDIIYRKQTHNVPGAAVQLHVSEGTARNWNQEFIYKVADYMGLL